MSPTTEIPFWSGDYTDINHNILGFAGISQQNTGTMNPAQTGFTQGADIRLLIELMDTATLIPLESASQAQTLDQISGQPFVSQQLGESSTAGLTPEEHDAVIETNQLSLAVNAATTAVVNVGSSLLQVPIGQILSFIRPDAWRLVDLGGGITCDHIGVDLSDDALWGVIVRITQYPDTTVFKTPDNGYTFNDLAVLTFIHAGDIVQRHGIHTVSHTVSPLPAVSLPWPNNFGWPIQPSDYHVTVDWAPGVCGELLGLRLP